MVVYDHFISGFLIMAVAAGLALVFLVLPALRASQEMRLIRGLLISICAVGVVIGSYNIAYPTEVANIRITVKVDDNGKEVIGSSVWQVRYARFPGLIGPAPGGGDFSYYGDAVIVDLGARGLLFALFQSEKNKYNSFMGTHGARSIPDFIYNIHVEPTIDPDKWRDRRYGEITYIKNLGAKGQIEYRPGDELLHDPEYRNGHVAKPKPRSDGSIASYAYPPKLVMFKDIKDHKTLTVVDPTNLAALFGVGVTLKSITAEPTLDARTHNGIENIVPIPSPRYEPPNVSSSWDQRHWELRVDRFKGD